MTSRAIEMSSQRLAKCPEILQKGKNVHLTNFLSH